MPGARTLFLGAPLDDSVDVSGTESGDALERLEAKFPQVSGGSAQLVVTGQPGTVIDQGARASAINWTTDPLRSWPDVDLNR